MPSPQFLTIEAKLYDECVQRNKEDKHITPKDDAETHDETRKRRRTIRESIETEEEKKLRLANHALRNKRKWAEEKSLALGKESSKVEIASIDVTNMLLKACGVRKEDICSQVKGEVVPSFSGTRK